MTKTKLPIAFLGLPLSTLSMEETVSKILNLINAYKKDLQPRYVATVNVDFIVNADGWNYSDTRFPELLHILRRASVSTIDGMPIVWACRCMGSHSIERVSGSDLLPRLAEGLNRNKYSAFLLGGTEKSLKLCKLYLEAMFPDLKIVGSAHPKIDVNGEDLAEAETRDALLIEQINKSNPDVLFINLGNPKQEIWHERVKHKLRVPISIGIGGSFDILTGIKSRAPLWMQQSGLEWLHRLIQEPERLWKRYFIDVFKFTYMAIPLLLYHNISRLLYALLHRRRDHETVNFMLFISTKHTIALSQLPKRLDIKASGTILNSLDDLLSQDVLIFDCKDICHFDLEGIWLFLHIDERVKREKKQFLLLNLSGDMQLLLKLHRIWDVVRGSNCHSPTEALERINCNGARFYDAISQELNHVVISIFGQLDNGTNYEEYLKKLKPVIHLKDCVIDFRYCSYIDNTGFQFLLKLKCTTKEQGTQLTMRNLSLMLQKQFKIAGVSIT